MSDDSGTTVVWVVGLVVLALVWLTPTACEHHAEIVCIDSGGTYEEGVCKR